MYYSYYLITEIVIAIKIIYHIDNIIKVIWI